MIKKLMITTAFIALSTPAFALFNGGDTYNNTDNSTTNAPVANGGNAKSKSSATGGSATQGQIQGQVGINKSSNKNKVNTNVNTSDFNSNKSNSTAKQSQDASSSNSIAIGGDNYQAAAAGAFAYSPVPTSDCLGSAGVSGQWTKFGFGLGGTTQSKPCNVREFAKIMAAFGKPDISFAILCQDPIVKASVESTGQLCPNSDALKVIKAESKKEERLEEACKYPTETCKILRKAL